MKFWLVLLFAVLCMFQGSYCCHSVRIRIRAFIRGWFGNKNEKKSEKPAEPDFKAILNEFDIKQSERKFIKKVLADIPLFGSLESYSDKGGCYEEGFAHSYRGTVSVTATGEQCVKWSTYSEWLSYRMKRSQQQMEKLKRDKGFFSFPQDAAMDLAIITGANDTRRAMEEEGLLDHNFCRDPDKSGVPWCFVNSIIGVLWEPCAVPKCTMCWRMRQRAMKFFHIPILAATSWVPSCTQDGAFAATQCWGAYCWCSDRDGVIIKGTLSRIKDSGKPYCGVNFQSAVPRFKAKRSTTIAPQSVPTKSLISEIEEHIKKKKKETSSKNKPFAKQQQQSEKQQKPFKMLRAKRASVSKSKSKNPNLPQLLRFKRLLKSFVKKKKFTKSNLNKTKKEIVLKQSPHPILNCSYEKGNPYTTTHHDKQYTCQMTYLVTHVIRCLKVKIQHNSESKGSGFDSQYTQQCLVEKKRQVNSWRCSRRLNDTKWYSFSFNRINSSITSLKNLTSYAGMSFICTKMKAKGKDHVIKCKAMNRLLTYIFTRHRRGKEYRCTVSYRDGILNKQKCIRIGKKKKEKKNPKTVIIL